MGLVFLEVFVFPGPAVVEDLLFGEGALFVGEGFVVGVVAFGDWEKFAPFAGLLHVGDDAGGEVFVFFGGVFFVEDTVFHFFEADAAETVFGGEALVAISEIAAAGPAEVAEAEVEKVVAAGLAFVEALGVDPPVAVIHAVFGFFDAETVAGVFAVVGFEAHVSVAAVVQVIAEGVFDVYTVELFDDQVFEHFLGLFFALLDDFVAAEV